MQKSKVLHQRVQTESGQSHTCERFAVGPC